MLGKVIYLRSKEDYETLLSEGTLTVGDVTITYSDQDLYMVPDDIPQIYVHNINVDTTTASGSYDYRFQVRSPSNTPFTTLGQAGHFLFENYKSVKIPASGTYTENNIVYIVISVRSSANDNMCIVEMIKLSDGTKREIETGMVDAVDTIMQ